ncbi:MAG TPA: sigma-70 family RNA polymerase sigma factor [Anaerolineae bacterium]
MIDDEVLIRQAQTGDRLAFAALYDRYYQPIYTRIYYRVSDRATAEELAANVFVRMVEKLGQYRTRGQPFLAWLYTIARNLLTDYYRQSSRATLVSLDDQFISAPDNPESMTETLLTAECLERAMRHLTEEQQEVIILGCWRVTGEAGCQYAGRWLSGARRAGRGAGADDA